MKKRMMMLLTTVALVMGLTACGDSTASTGNDAASNSTPSLVVEGTSEPTAEPMPEVTPEPTAEPAPQYTEVTIRDIQFLKKTVNGKELWLPLIDGELPDASLTMAEMYFHVPEGMSVTYEDIVENAKVLYGIDADELPGQNKWASGVSHLVLDWAVDMSGASGNDYALSDNYTGDFHTTAISREDWESMFTLVRHKSQIEGEAEYWINSVEIKEEFLQSKKDAVVELFNNYTYTEAYDALRNAYGNYSSISADYIKFWTMSDVVTNEIVQFRTDDEAAFEAYKADPTGWVDTYAEFKQQ